MIKKILLLIILTVTLFSLSGCQSSISIGIDNYYFIISLGIDEAENDLIKLSIQISSNSSGSSSDSSAGSSSQSSKTKIYSVEARTIDEGLIILNNYLNKQINLSHCSALVISENIAKKGIQTYINTLSNNSELRHTCKIIISSSTAYDVLKKVENSGEAFSARLFDYLSQTTDYTGFTVKSTFGDFFQSLDNNYYEPTAIYIIDTGDTIQTSGLAIFKGDKMVGHLDGQSSIAHLATINELNTCTITIESPFSENENIDIEMELYKKTDIKINIINNTPFISVTIYPEGTIKSSGSTFNYIKNNIEKLEVAMNQYLEKHLREYYYNISKTYNSDVIGFKSIYQSTLPTKDEFDKVHWDEIFQDSFFEVTVKSKVNSSNLFNKE